MDERGHFRATSELAIHASSKEFELRGGNKTRHVYQSIMQELVQSEPAQPEAIRMGEEVENIQ